MENPISRSPRGPSIPRYLKRAAAQNARIVCSFALSSFLVFASHYVERNNHRNMSYSCSHSDSAFCVPVLLLCPLSRCSEGERVHILFDNLNCSFEHLIVTPESHHIIQSYLVPPTRPLRRCAQMILKFADISNTARCWTISRRWARAVCAEFWRQGDLERDGGVPLSPGCDRRTNSTAALQTEFLSKARIIVHNN